MSERLTTWRTSDGHGLRFDGHNSIGWHGRLRLGSVQFGWHVYRHTYRAHDTRWVFQPFAILDRRAA